MQNLTKMWNSFMLLFYWFSRCLPVSRAAKVCHVALRGWWFHLWKHLGAVGWQLGMGELSLLKLSAKKTWCWLSRLPQRRRLDGLAGCHGLTNRLRHDPDHVGVIIFQRYFSFRAFSRMSLENRGKQQMWTWGGRERTCGLTTRRPVDFLVFALI